MSATLGALLRLVEPDWSITLVERLDGAAAESSDPWNNAGTGHSALCELNYTPQRPDGTIDITKAVHVNEQFQVSRQFWALRRRERRAARRPQLPQPDPARQLRARAQTRRRICGAGTTRSPATRCSRASSSSTTADEFARRLPFMAAKRDFSEPVALNWTPDGTDVDFGVAVAPARSASARSSGTTTLFGHDVRDLDHGSPTAAGRCMVRNRRTGEKRKFNAKFVFVGAGGGALPLLQKSGIKEVKGFGGFPIGGRFLRADNAGAHRRAPGQGVRRCRRWARRRCRCAHLDTPRRQRQVVAGVRSVRRLVAEVLEARALHRPAPLGQAEQPGVDARRRGSPRWRWSTT